MLTDSRAGGNASRRTYVVVGDGAAGMTAAQVLRGHDRAASITVVADDPHPAYFRAALTNYLLGELRDEQVWAVPPSFYTELNVQRILARVAGVDAARGQVWLSTGSPLSYDALFLGTGARARPAPFEGGDLPGVGTLRTLQDARWVMDAIKLHALRRAVVVGGGPLAIEWALAMRERGVQVTMIIREQGMMLGPLDQVGSDLLLARLRQGGIEMKMSEEVQAAYPGRDGAVAGVRTKSGQTIPCELVAVAIGVICNTELLAGSGIALGARGGVAIDDHMRTNAYNVFAAGDVAELRGELTQLWEPARRQAQVAASNMAMHEAIYTPGIAYFATRLFDLDFASLGFVGRDPVCEELVDSPRNTGRISYRKLVLRSGKLVGALLLGERAERVRSRGRLFKQLIDRGVEVDSVRGSLLDPTFDLQAWMQGRSLIHRPKDSGAAGQEVPVAAQLRGTHHVRLIDMNLSVIAEGRALPGSEVPLARSARSGAIGAGELRQPGTMMWGPERAGHEAGSGPPAARDAPKAGTMLRSIGMRFDAAAPPGAAPPSIATNANGEFLEGASRRWELTAPVINIGRDPAAPVSLQDPGVSFVHAQITRHANALYLRDLGSRNGSWVNARPVTVPHLLQDADRLRLGSTELIFRATAKVHLSAGGERVAPGHSLGAAVLAAGGASVVAHLEGRSGHSLGLSFALVQSPVTVGREPTNTIRLDDLTISRRHAMLTQTHGGWVLLDLQSSSGTLRNGVRLVPGQESPLADGDILQFGSVVVAFVLKALQP